MPQGLVISPALFNHFVSDCPLTDLDMTSYADEFTVMATSSHISEAEAEVNGLLSALVEWTERKELSIAPHKSSVTLFTPDTHQSQYHPHVKIHDSLLPLDRSP